jgi:ribonuclease-3
MASRQPRRPGTGSHGRQAIRPDLEPLESHLGRRFRDRNLLGHALVHRSYLNEANRPDTDSNERLEFLGDAVLGFVVARELYRRFPTALEGQLTELRAHLVRWETLAEAAKRLDLGAHLELGRGEEQTGGRQRPLNLARAFEAVVGAVLEDGSLDEAEGLILRLLQPELDALQATTNMADVKSRLQEWAQSRLGAIPVYRTVDIAGPDHERTYRVEVQVGDQVMGEGAGRNKRTAERAAAAEALERLADDTG